MDGEEELGREISKIEKLKIGRGVEEEDEEGRATLRKSLGQGEFCTTRRDDHIDVSGG